MNILYVAAEAAPFIKTGGLADVAGSLPKALNAIGNDCRVVLPLYGQIPAEYKTRMKKEAEFYVEVGWKNEYCGIYSLVHDGVTFYFLDNMYYFNRPEIYGQIDDGERFIFYCKASVRLPRVLDWPIDVLHANDWHGALSTVFLNAYRTGDDFYKDTRSVFTIHNLRYQGQFSPDLFYWMNLNGSYFTDYDLKFYDSINFLKGGIVHSTKVNTVSPTYAEEIHFPFFAEGLENVITANSYKISGILNGIDYDVWNPETDTFIDRQYNLESLEKRKTNKKKLQELYNLPVRDDVPLIGMVTRLNSMKGLDLVRYIMDDFIQDDVQIAVLGTGDDQYEEMFKSFAARYPDKLAARIYFSNEESHKIYSASDLFLMPSVIEPCGLSQMIAMRYGALPLVREAGGLRDSVSPYNMYEKSGDGFSFANINAHDLLYTLRMACDLYRNNPEDWNMLQYNAMVKDFSWDVSSHEYMDLYRSLNPFGN